MKDPKKHYVSSIYIVILAILAAGGLLYVYAPFISYSFWAHHRKQSRIHEMELATGRESVRPKLFVIPAPAAKKIIPAAKPVTYPETILPEDHLKADGLYPVKELKGNQSYEERHFETNAYFYQTLCSPCPVNSFCSCFSSPILSDEPLKKDQLNAWKDNPSVCRILYPVPSDMVAGQRYHLTLSVKKTKGTPPDQITILSFGKTCSKELEAAIKNKVIGTDISYISESIEKIQKVVKEENVLSIEICDCGRIAPKSAGKQCYRVSVGDRISYPKYFATFAGWSIYLDMETLEKEQVEQLFRT